MILTFFLLVSPHSSWASAEQWVISGSVRCVLMSCIVTRNVQLSPVFLFSTKIVTTFIIFYLLSYYTISWLHLEVRWWFNTVSEWIPFSNWEPLCQVGIMCVVSQRKPTMSGPALGKLYKSHDFGLKDRREPFLVRWKGVSLYYYHHIIHVYNLCVCC